MTMIRMAAMSVALVGMVGPALAQAQNSHCAGLPSTARVEVRGPDNVIPAQLTPRGLACPRGFTTETVGPVTRCRQPGPARLENREPRAACYADIGLSVPRNLPSQNRPTANCRGTPTIASVIAIRGRNLGWRDVAATVPRESGATIEHLTATGGRVPAAEDPAVQDCFAFNCRLVRLTLRPNSPDNVPITFAAPGNAATATVTVTNAAACPTG
jgi:hypothetical protein